MHSDITFFRSTPSAPSLTLATSWSPPPRRRWRLRQRFWKWFLVASFLTSSKSSSRFFVRSYCCFAGSVKLAVAHQRDLSKLKKKNSNKMSKWQTNEIVLLYLCIYLYTYIIFECLSLCLYRDWIFSMWLHLMHMHCRPRLHVASIRISQCHHDVFSIWICGDAANFFYLPFHTCDDMDM